MSVAYKGWLVAYSESISIVRYGLKVDNNPILAEEKHKTLLSDLIQQYSVEYVPGGATLNVIRVAQVCIPIYAVNF